MEYRWNNLSLGLDLDELHLLESASSGDITEKLISMTPVEILRRLWNIYLNNDISKLQSVITQEVREIIRDDFIDRSEGWVEGVLNTLMEYLK